MLKWRFRQTTLLPEMVSLDPEGEESSGNSLRTELSIIQSYITSPTFSAALG